LALLNQCRKHKGRKGSLGIVPQNASDPRTFISWHCRHHPNLKLHLLSLSYEAVSRRRKRYKIRGKETTTKSSYHQERGLFKYE
jgi:hypothetical protein